VEPPTLDSPDQYLDGSPIDRFVFACLLVAGLMVLFSRRRQVGALLRKNWPILLFFSYCALSLFWSEYPFVAFKRWTKAVGDLVMVLVILTDGHPIAALRRVYSRVGFILFPFSVMMIRYTDLGRGYDPDGTPENVGVTTNKNILGLVVFVISLGVLWNVRSLFLHKDEAHRGRRLVAQFTLLGFGIALLQMAHSATAVICFILGAGVLFATNLEFIKKSPRRVLALSLGVVLVGGLGLLFGGGSAVSESLGRGAGLSGRTDIWAAALSAVGNPVIGTGFESFWNANATRVNQALLLRGFRDLSNLNSAHNGYLQIYLDLGLVGAGLLVLLLFSGYRYASKAFEHNPEVGSLLLACIATGTFYSITEAGFRTMTPTWIFLLLGVIGSGAAARGLLRDQASPAFAPEVGIAKSKPARNKLSSEKKPLYTTRRGTTSLALRRAITLK
jgi:O-antigen ligase